MNARTLVFLVGAALVGVALLSGTGAAADVTAANADVVVGNSSTADAATIQGGINQAPSGGTVFVESGIYAGNVTVTKSVTIVGPSATIAGTGSTNGGTGIVARAPTEVVGLSIGAIETGIAVDTNRTVRVENVLIGDTSVAIDGTDAPGSLIVEGSQLRANRAAIARSWPSGNLAVTNTSIDAAGRGIDVAMSSMRSSGAPSGTSVPDTTVTISNVTVVANDSAVGVRAGDLTVDDLQVYSRSNGLTAVAGTARLTDLTVEAQGYGVVMWTANGVGLAQSQITAGTVGLGVNGGNATIQGSVIDAGTDGVVADSTNAALDSVRIDAGRDGLALSDGLFALDTVGVTANRTAINVSAARLDATAVSAEGWRGVHALGTVSVVLNRSDVTGTHAAIESPADGSITVSKSWLSTGTSPTVRASGSAAVTIARSEFATTGLVVDASGRSAPVNTTGVWWGQSGGPTEAAVSGPVESTDPAPEPVAPTAVVDRGLPVDSIDGTVPRDIDFDGQFEDFSGDGVLNFPDVNIFFQHSDRPVVTDFAQYYDFTGEGSLNLQDVMKLFLAV
ncbi:MAG: hypothetical protein ABEJ86_06575 [Halococcoides sp.]